MGYYLDLFLYFAIYSFLGWTMETLFAGIEQKKFINRGFLAGCFCPIYGFGAVFIILSSHWADSILADSVASMIVYIFFAVILVTVLEYITGYVLERIFECKWWDYSGYPANIKGYICLRFSLLWGFLAFLLIKVAHPGIAGTVDRIPDTFKVYIVAVLAVYFLADTTKTVIGALELRKVILDYANFPVNHYREKIFRYKRFFFAFPRLLILNAGIINHDVRSILNDRFNKIKVELKNRFQSL